MPDTLSPYDTLSGPADRPQAESLAHRLLSQLVNPDTESIMRKLLFIAGLLAAAGAVALTPAEAGDGRAQCATFSNPEASDLEDFLDDHALRRNTRVISGAGGSFQNDGVRRRGSANVMWICAY